MLLRGRGGHGDEPFAQLGRRRDGLALAEAGGGRQESHQLDTTLLALGEVGLETAAFVCLQRVERVRGDQVMEVYSHATTPMQSRRRTSPSRIRVLMVEGFASSTEAHSAYV